MSDKINDFGEITEGEIKSITNKKIKEFRSSDSLIKEYDNKYNFFDLIVQLGKIGIINHKEIDRLIKNGDSICFVYETRNIIRYNRAELNSLFFINAPYPTIKYKGKNDRLNSSELNTSDLKLISEKLKELETCKQTRVVCACNLLTDPVTGKEIKLLGTRHWDEIMRENLYNLGYKDEDIPKLKVKQGFIDNSRNFISRDEAMLIALKSNQIQYNHAGDILFSEDLY